MTTNMAPFLCDASDETLREQLGTGICIGVMLTQEGPKNMVLWDNVRQPSPSFHSPDEVEWIGIYDADDLGDDDDDDDDDDDNDDDEVETEDEIESEPLVASGVDDNSEGVIVDTDYAEATIVSNEVDTETVASP